MTSDSMLTVDNISAGYGPNLVLHDISLSVARGEIVALMGANGAGKSTLLKCIIGAHRPSTGEITFCGADIVGCSPGTVAEMGVAMVPEGRRLFPTQTIHQNLLVAGWVQRKHTNVNRRAQEVYDRFPMLQSRKSQRAGTLSGGEAQLLAIGMALMSHPSLLILDEPSLGLAPLVIKRVFEEVEALRQAGTAILIVEQNATTTLTVADRGYVLKLGRVVFEGPAAIVADNPELKAAYL